MTKKEELVCLHLAKRMFDECGMTKAEEFIRRVEAGEHDVPSPWSSYTSFSTIDVQLRIANWVVSRLGFKAMVSHERGRRCVEEILELAQCCNVTEKECNTLVKHVYAKPVGDIEQEFGGAILTLLACAEGAHYLLSACAEKELDRIESLPPEKFRKRQAENVSNGIGSPGE